MPKYRFSEIAINVTDKRMPVPEDKDLYIAPNNLDTDTLSVPEFGYKVDLNGTKLIMHKGDMLFGRREPQLKKAAIAPHDGLFSAHGMIFHPREEVVTKEFFPFFISSDYFFDAAIRISVGSLSPTVNWKDLKDLEFNIPDLTAQQEYAKVLWAMIRAKKAYKELIKKTDDLVKSQFIEMFGNPATNSKGLKAEPLSRHLSVTGGFAFKSKEFREDGGIPVLRIGNINSGRFLKTNMVYWPYDESLKRYFCRPGDLVISLTGTVGKGDYANICRLGNEFELYYLNQRNAKLTLNDSVLPEYMTALLSNDEIKSLLTGAGQGVRQANISNADILNLIVPIPAVEDQQAFARLVEQSDKSKFAAQQALKEVTDAQKALMKKIFE